MPSFSQPVENNQIIINVALSPGAGEPRSHFKAILDTGAQITAISPNAIKQLGLLPTGSLSLAVASGQKVSTFEYHARVDIPIRYNLAAVEGESSNFFYGKGLSVAGLVHDPDGYDVLLGMDLIGTFHVTIYNNRIILSN